MLLHHWQFMCHNIEEAAKNREVVARKLFVAAYQEESHNGLSATDRRRGSGAWSWEQTDELLKAKVRLRKARDHENSGLLE